MNALGNPFFPVRRVRRCINSAKEACKIRVNVGILRAAITESEQVVVVEKRWQNPHLAAGSRTRNKSLRLAREWRRILVSNDFRLDRGKSKRSGGTDSRADSGSILVRFSEQNRSKTGVGGSLESYFAGAEGSFTLVYNQSYIREEVSKKFGNCEESLEKCNTCSQKTGSSGEAPILKPIHDRFWGCCSSGGGTPIQTNSGSILTPESMRESPSEYQHLTLRRLFEPKWMRGREAAEQPLVIINNAVKYLWYIVTGYSSSH
ncbi:hypothetical protein B0H13DRAFT_1878356 [Mycena leptocephala]|nr:hypothetical protein B0H13DRAFT_1878356 [Mycena leptocephala]